MAIFTVLLFRHHKLFCSTMLHRKHVFQEKFEAIFLAYEPRTGKFWGYLFDLTCAFEKLWAFIFQNFDFRSPIHDRVETEMEYPKSTSYSNGYSDFQANAGHREIIFWPTGWQIQKEFCFYSFYGCVFLFEKIFSVGNFRKSNSIFSTGLFLS